jgi:hypothetical protein
LKLPDQFLQIFPVTAFQAIGQRHCELDYLTKREPPDYIFAISSVRANSTGILTLCLNHGSADAKLRQ